MTDAKTKKLYMRQVREYFAELPPLQPDTVDIILRSHLHVPENLMERARAEAQAAHLAKATSGLAKAA